MYIIRRCVCAALTLSAALFVNGIALGQEQVLADVGAVGANTSGQGVVKPDFADKVADSYTNWVAPAGNRNFKAMAISPSGTALVLDGNVIREYNSAGTQLNSVDCTVLTFNKPKKNGSMVPTNLTSCGAFTPLNNGKIVIAGEAKGGGFVIIEYDPVAGTGTLKADGTPPSISDMDGDEYADAGDRKGPGYWAVGDKKKVIWFPLVPTSADDFEVVATLNGKNIDGVTPFGPGRVITVLDTGELVEVSTSNGSTTFTGNFVSPTGCTAGRKDPQHFSVRGDPSGALYAGSRFCKSIKVLDTNLGLLPSGPGEEIVSNPFILSSPSSFAVTGLDWQAGQGGDFNADGCNGNAIENGCQYGQKNNQAVMWNVQAAGNTTYRMFQFNGIVDCRWSGDRPCPIINCSEAATGEDESSCPPKETQVLDLAPLLIDADLSGAFESAAFPDGPVVMAIPAYLRGELCYPAVTPDVTAQGDCVAGEIDNGARFNVFFAVTDAFFTGIHFADYKINEFRANSNDECTIPTPFSSIGDVNETANIILYNSGDGFGTVNRGGAQGNRGGVISNTFCNGGRTGARWSANTIGLELYADDDTAYIPQVQRMMDELFDARDELICGTFPNPEGGPDLGPLLSNCSSIDSELNQMADKLDFCINSLFKDNNGGNATPNCNAFFTKVDNMRAALDAAPWPAPNPLDLAQKPNYEGEFRVRVDALEFFVESYLLNSVPAGGFD